MTRTKFCWVGVALVVLLFGSSGFAQEYVGDTVCMGCHAGVSGQDFVDGYMRTGHPWMLVKTGGVDPTGDPTKTPPWSETGLRDALPTLPGETTWDEVNYYFGFFRPGASGYALNMTGGNINFGGAPYCGAACHTTGYDPDGGTTDGINGTWVQEGIRCEACHGPQSDHANGGAFDGIFPDLDVAKNACANCHYAGDDNVGIDYETPEEAPPFGAFSHHPQWELYAASPHAVLEDRCAACHSPHKSTVWDDGGVEHVCTDCHDAEDHQIHTGGSGMAELDCTDCHMPKVSSGGSRYAHLFRIMTDPISAEENTHVVDDAHFWNVDAEGQGALTLDFVCLRCHDGEDAFAMTLEGAAAAAEGIHTPPTPPDLEAEVEVNESHDFQVFGPNDVVEVDVSLDAGAQQDVPADWFVLASTNWGWYYWDPLFGWQPGFYPSLVDFQVFDVVDYNLYDGTLFPGYYTFWFGVFADDGAWSVDTVPTYIFP